MRKLGIAAVAALLVAGVAAPAADAAKGPCETQRELFEKYNIETNLDAPAVAWAYNTACGVTG